MTVCEIVSIGPLQRLGSYEVSLPCSTCGARREMTLRNKRRILAGDAPSTCGACRTSHPKIVVKESHRLFWLRRFGCDLKGRSAAQYVAEEGLPPEVDDILESIDLLLRRAA